MVGCVFTFSVIKQLGVEHTLKSESFAPLCSINGTFLSMLFRDIHACLTSEKVYSKWEKMMKVEKSHAYIYMCVRARARACGPSLCPSQKVSVTRARGATRVCGPSLCPSQKFSVTLLFTCYILICINLSKRRPFYIHTVILLLHDNESNLIVHF